MSIVYIVSAPSGSGKSTLVSELFKVVKHLDFSISYTTRPPRGSEQNGKEYFFVTKDQFEAMIKADEFLEYANVFGNYYGTAKRFLRDAEARGNDLLLDIDVQGAQQIKQRLPEAVSIFILPPDREKLEWRLRNRGLDSEEVIRRRLDTARREIENYSKYDYILVNERLEQATDELKAVVLAERILRSGATPSPEELRLLGMAQAIRLDQARERVQPILESFGARAAEVSLWGRESMKLIEGFDSNYRYILVAARRARQLQGGAPPVIETISRKPCRIAQDEIRAGKVKWLIPEIPKTAVDSATEALDKAFLPDA